MELDYNKLLSLTAEMGLCLMESGAETYRVEESMHRLLSAYGVAGEVFAIPNCIIATLTSPERRPLTQIRRVPAHGTDIDQLERYNDLCRRLCREAPELDAALEQVAQIGRERRSYPLYIRLAGYFLGCGMFSLFYGGTLRDGLCGGVCGVAIGLCLALTGAFGANLFFKTVAGAAVSALTALLLTAAGLGQSLDKIIIGALLKGTALISENHSCRAGSHIAHNDVERAHFPEPCFKVFRAVENILLHESNLGGKNRPRRLEVTAQHQPLRPHLFGSAKRPGSGGSSEIEHAHAAPENLELAVNLFQLVDTSCRVVLLFCLEEVMVAVFLHALSVFIHVFPARPDDIYQSGCRTGRKPCAMI